MAFKILIMGLPGAGKTTLAIELVSKLKGQGRTVDWFNADEVRKQADDWDFSSRGRLRQASRMKNLADSSTCDYVICDFVAPMVLQRELFKADFTVWVDTINKSVYENTNSIFAPPWKVDVQVTTKDVKHWSEVVINKINAY